MTIERRVELSFGRESRDSGTHTNLSAVRRDGPCLWVAGDETASIERLTAVTDAAGEVTGYAGHQSVRLADLVRLPAGPDEEADIEGLARGGGWLWAVGSHSLKRKRIKDKHSDARARERLATVEREENRFVLARIPVETGDDGLPSVVREAADGRTAAILGGHGDALTGLLAGDPHLAPFLALPGKDNGLDVEGIAAYGDRLLIGLRGPVLRGWAVLVEIEPRTHADHPHRLALRPLDGDGARYRTHFLDLGGLGIRDLCPYGNDLLILAGPSMDLDGPVRVLRWRNAAPADAPGIIRAAELTPLTDLPHGTGADHAEGITVLPDDRLLVVYDSPAPHRRTPASGILADVVAL